MKKKMVNFLSDAIIWVAVLATASGIGQLGSAIYESIKHDF